jgi:hypothetical protein
MFPPVVPKQFPKSAWLCWRILLDNRRCRHTLMYVESFRVNQSERR